MYNLTEEDCDELYSSPITTTKSNSLHDGKDEKEVLEHKSSLVIRNEDDDEFYNDYDMLDRIARLVSRQIDKWAAQKENKKKKRQNRIENQQLDALLNRWNPQKATMVKRLLFDIERCMDEQLKKRMRTL